MQFRARVFALVIGLAALGVGHNSLAAVIYDSNGFDNVTRFNPAYVAPGEPSVVGNLRDQDPAVNQWLYSGPNTATSTTGTARVINTTSLSPSQSVQVDRISADNRWAAPNVAITPAGSLNVVDISWDMNVLPTTTDSSKFGPFFGIEAYGGTGVRLGAVGVDATTGELLYESPTFNVVDFNPSTGFGFQPGAGWHHYQMEFNYGSDTYNAWVDGVQKLSGQAFLNASTQFTDADISALQAAPTGFDNATGTAYFDNYVVTSVPEPTSAMLIGLATLALGCRRRALLA
ncbi:MAG TPA: PEP-CTERM sorting domain-containing protein [Tepidisphaeraceae bacterium]|nr:PEP-CTERM sorting domain-containing protein [Tepidisphaeraceae bacterium]